MGILSFSMRRGQTRTHSFLRGIHELLGAIALAAVMGVFPTEAATIPEPDTVFYGRVLNFDHGKELPVTLGTLVWTISPEGNGGRTYRLETSLEQNTNSGFSYRLKVPHEALVVGLSGTDISSSAVPQGNADARYGHADIRVNGEVARVLPPAPSVFNVSSDHRASAYRIDLEIAVPMADSDGQGLPDWWQQQYFGRLGTDPNADPDHDGWSNRIEYLAGTDPTQPNATPTIAWDQPSVDEGATEFLTLRAVDSDTAPAQLVYTLTREPQGVSVRQLFGATKPGLDGKRGDRQLHAGDTFTQAQLDEGRMVVTHDDPTASQAVLGLSLTDGNPSHPPFVTNLVAVISKPTSDDGSGASIWLDAREAAAKNAGGAVTVWDDRSGPKTLLDGSTGAFDGHAGAAALPLAARGPLGQKVVGFNLGGQTAPQWLSLPTPDKATVFQSGDLTIFAVVNPLGGGAARQQVVNGANFQLAFVGDDERGRANQMRFASEGLGVVYSNHRVNDQWNLVTAWQDQDQLNVELNGGWSGGPQPLDEAVALGSDPVVGAKETQGAVAEPFHGYLAELLVFNRNLEGAERQRINSAMLSKWFGWVIVDGSAEERDVTRRVPSTGLSAQEYQTSFLPRYGPDRHYVLIGGGGRDVLQGGQNDDIIIGGRNDDLLSGGGGRDRFVFNYAHIHHAADTITDFDPVGDRDVIDLTDLLRGTSKDLRDYVRLRTDGHNSYLDLDFTGGGKYTDHTIVIQNNVLRDEDRYRLWAQGNLLTGDKRFPLAATLAVVKATAAELAGEAALVDIAFTGGPSVPSGLELPFSLGGTAVRDVDYTLSVQRYNESTGAYDWVSVEGQELAVQLKAGDLDFGLRIEPLPNSKSDPARTVHFSLTPVPERYDTPGAAVTALIVDAPQKVWVSAMVNQAVPGGANGLFRVSREGSLDVPLDVSVRMAGPAANGIDYTYIPTVVHFAAGEANVDVILEALLDENAKPARTSEFVIEAGLGYFVDPSGQSATVTIVPSLPLVTVEAYEPLAVQSEGIPGSFLFKRRGPTSATLTVLFEVNGSAVMGRDYQKITRWVVFSPGTTLMVVPVAPLSGANLTGIKTIGVNLLADPSFNFGASRSAEVRLVATGATFGGWKSSLFPNDTTMPEAFALRDTDGDGMVNLVEYAFGFDARTVDTKTPGLPKPIIIDGRLGIRYTRPVAVEDVDYLIETSTDLRTWQAANTEFDRVSSRLLDLGNEEVTFLSHASAVSTLGQEFVRVRLQLR